MAASDAKFHWADYLVFVLSLLVSLSVGVFFAFKDRNKKTPDEFLLGGRSMNLVPVSLSLMASFISGVSVLGFPAQVYFTGAIYLLLGVSFMISGLITALFFIPTIHGMKITSTYEYFERRYGSRALRSAVSVVFAAGLLMYLSLVLYGPALAFSEVTGLGQSFSILTCGVVCTIYTSLGGIKAVIWTDTIQMCTIFGGLILMVVMGITNDDVGSTSLILERATDGQRMEFNIWDVDPRVRQTVWTQVIGWGFTWISIFGTNQISLQRYMAIEKKRDAQLAMIIVVVGEFALLTLIGILGLTMYSYYYYCDPLKSGRIQKTDQIVPRYMMDIMGDLHGLPGLFTSAVFAAALSTVSSAVNSLSAVTLEDFVKPIYSKVTHKEMPLPMALHLSRIMAILYGIVTIGMSFAAEYFGDDISSIAGSIFGILGAPVTGCFTLGMLVSWSTGTGCLLGLLCGVFMGVWMEIGGILYKTSSPGLPLNISGCAVTTLNETVTMVTEYMTTESFADMSNLTTAPPASTKDENIFQDLYDVSYAWYGLITFSTVITVGLIVSIVDLGCKKRYEVGATVDSSLMFDTASRCCCCCPRACRRHVQGGVPFDKPLVYRETVDGHVIKQEKNTLEMNGVTNDAFATNTVKFN